MTTWWVWWLAMLMSVLVCCIIFLLYRMAALQEELLHCVDAEHTKCIGAIMAFVGDEFAANVLRVAADDLDAVSEKVRINQIARDNYVADGPSVPALWLMDRANRLTEAFDD